MSKDSEVKDSLSQGDLWGAVHASLRIMDQLPPITHVERTGPIPISSAQGQLWLIQQGDPANVSYNLPFAWRLRGRVNAYALSQSLEALVQRHEILRTTFVMNGDEPVQIILPASNVELVSCEVKAESGNQIEAQIDRMLRERTGQPFNLGRGPLLRAYLFKISEEDHVFLLVMHHIVMDGASIAVINRELGAFYKAFCAGGQPNLPAMPIQYADFALWQKQWLTDELLSNQFAYWKGKLAGELPVLEIPSDHVRPSVRSSRGAIHFFRLPPEALAALEGFKKKEKSTVFNILLTVYKILLLRYTGQTDIVIGTPIANRNRTELQPLIGFFPHTIVLRTALGTDLSFYQCMERVQSVALEAFANQDVSFDKLLGKLKPKRDLSHTPIFQTMFSFQRMPRRDLELSGLTLQSIDVDAGTSKYDFTLDIKETSQGIAAFIEYNTDLFCRATIERMAEHFKNLLVRAIENPDLPVGKLPILTDAERNRILLEWNRRECDFPVNDCITGLFETQVEKTPDQVAVIDGEQRITYSELNIRANQLAHCLRNLGVGPQVMVGVCLERSVDSVITLLGCLKAGATYVPLDPDYPAERLGFMLRDSCAPVLVTHKRLADWLTLAGQKLVLLDTEATQIASESGCNLEQTARPENTVYVIYTSGSTGRPKGAAIYRRSFSNLLNWYLKEFSITAQDRLMVMGSPGFDMTQKNFFASLLCGAQLYVLEPGVFDPTLIVEQIQRNQITIINCTPSAFYSILDVAGGNAFRALQSLRCVVLGGESLAKAHLRPWLESPFCRAEVGNIYGPTECTDIATIYRITRSNLDRYETIPLGGPIDNVKLVILDSHLQLCPVGVPGELCIGGVGVGAGYVNDPEKTSSRFIKNPIPEIPSERLYRSGDLVRRLADGTIDFIGRMDFQIKIRGFRVELGEIETLLRSHANIREAVVIAQETGSGEKRLMAFLEPRNAPAPESAELREFVKKELPDYMVPSLFIIMGALPVTSNGKINRKALQEMGTDANEKPRSVVAPRTDVENLLLDIWKDVLRHSQISIHDNFFELGGHSLLATQVVSRIRKVLKKEISIRCFFQHPTVAELSAALENEARSVENPIDLVDRAGEMALSSTQRRLWFLEQLEPDSATYVIRLALRLQGSLNRQALQLSLNEIVRRHEALRTVFSDQGGKPVQVILPPYPVEVPQVDLSTMPTPERESEEKRIEVSEASQPINIKDGPIIRFKLLRLEEKHHVLLINVHHIAFDGWSCSVIFNELSALYEAFLAKKPSPLPDLAIQYADFAGWQRQWLLEPTVTNQMDYWKKQLQNPPPLSTFPLDHPRPPRQSYRGACKGFFLKSELIDSMKSLCQHEGCSLFMGLLASFGAVLHQYTGQDDLLIGSPIANRHRTEIEPLIGCFLNTLVLRTDFSGEPTFRQMLGRVREVTLEAYANQDMPFEKVIEEVKPVRDQSYSPLFQVMLILQNTPAFSATAGEVHVEAFDVDNKTTKFDLTISLNETAKGLAGTAEYASGLFESPTIQRILRCWEKLVSCVVACPDIPVSRVPIITEAERQTVIESWNSNEQALSPFKSLPDQFEQQVALTPQSIALVAGQTELTYAELNARANRLAHHLRQLGVGPEVLVGICLERSVEMIIAILGTLKSGGAYVPIDPAYPKDRRSYILQDARTPVLLTQSKVLDGWPELEQNSLKLVSMDVDKAVIEHYGHDNPAPVNKPDDLAYVLFTSGSTGRPKGVAIEHRSVLSLTQWAKSVYSTDELSGVLFATSICFDLSIFELLVPLCLGGKVILADNALQLPALPAAEQVKLVNTVPSAMAALVQDKALPPSVCTVNLAGEPLSTALVNQIYAFPHVQKVYDLYGPTEDTTYSTFALRKPDEPPTIGRPLANEQVYILDKHLQPTPIGVPGEIHISGAGLARGYLNHPELTRERFIRNPFSTAPGSRVYKTGDLARYRPDGNIEFLGRLDHQVKIRGFRIELGEIESVLRQQEDMKEVVVVSQTQNGDQRLVAYVVSQAKQAPSSNELRDFVRKTLPEYMVPAVFVTMEELPLTPNGKVDRKALPAVVIDRSQVDESFVGPKSATETELATIWTQVLKVERIGVNDNFFELGGHSLLATQVISRIHAQGYTKISLTDLFSMPTISALAKRADELKQSSKELPKIVALPRKRTR